MATDNSDSIEWDDVPAPVAPVAIDPSTMTTQSLQALQSDDQRRVMDIVDKLRRTGLGGVVSLPQLVVCGDQSSGKSSVLEAITEIPFPRKENLCTRFATEIILRRDPTSRIQVALNPDKKRPKREQAELRSFARTIEDFSQLPGIIEDATQAMGLGEVGQADARAFSRDVLTIEICGPDRPQLTVVDLPGLIHATSKAQTEADKELILDLVKDYMKNSRTIILAVVSAKNDFANQIILDHCRNIDKESERTLGIITKPDYLREGSQNELDWIELAQNKNIYFKLGWHMLRNRADTEMDFTFAQRNERETIFFSKGRYNGLPWESVGIDPLRLRLSQLLLGHLKKELPSLKDEMSTKLQTTVREIERLGERRTTIGEQRMMLFKVSMQTSDIIKSALEGHYRAAFFGRVDMDAAVDGESNLRRFRAVIQYLNTQFADNMRLRGHKFAVGTGPGDDDEDKTEDESVQKALLDSSIEDAGSDMEDADSDNEDADSDNEDSDSGSEDTGSPLPKPKQLTRKGAIAWVQRILERTRGSELKGDSNHFLVSQLFWEQSQPWKGIALEHVGKIARACRDFVHMVLEHSAPAEFLPKLAALNVDAALATALQGSEKELDKILADQQRYPMTYNHYFTTTLQKQRQRKHQKVAERAIETSKVEPYYDRTHHTHYDPALLQKAMADSIELNMDRFSSEEALDKQRAYYKVSMQPYLPPSELMCDVEDELKYFVNAVAKQVIERHLVEPLPEVILSPLIIHQLTDEEVRFIAAEPHELTHQREFLESRKDMLEKGMDTFRQAMGGLKPWPEGG